MTTWPESAAINLRVLLVHSPLSLFQEEFAVVLMDVLSKWSVETKCLIISLVSVADPPLLAIWPFPAILNDFPSGISYNNILKLISMSIH